MVSCDTLMLFPNADGGFRWESGKDLLSLCSPAWVTVQDGFTGLGKGRFYVLLIVDGLPGVVKADNYLRVVDKFRTVVLWVCYCFFSTMSNSILMLTVSVL